MTEPQGLHRKLAQVMYEAGRIPKNGRAPAAMGGFEFVQVGDAADYIRKALGEHGVSMLPTSVEVMGETEHETKSGGTMTTQTVRTTWTLTDGETGQTATIQSIGTGADTGDKFSPKAQTNSMKYALLMGFLLSTGDDPEQEDTADRIPRPRVVDRSTGEIRRQAPTVTVDGIVHIDEDKPSRDGQVRRDPVKGAFLGFRLRSDGLKGPIVEVVGELAERWTPVEGAAVTVEGHYEERSSPSIARPWQVLVAHAISGPEVEEDLSYLLDGRG